MQNMLLLQLSAVSEGSRRIPGQQEGCSGPAVSFGLNQCGSDCCSGM